MLIKILKRKSTPTHSLVEGMVVDLKTSDAEKLIDDGYAKKATKADMKKDEKGD